MNAVPWLGARVITVKSHAWVDSIRPKCQSHGPPAHCLSYAGNDAVGWAGLVRSRECQKRKICQTARDLLCFMGLYSDSVGYEWDVIPWCQHGWLENPLSLNGG